MKLLLVALAFSCGFQLAGQQMNSCSMHEQHSKGVQTRGEQAMGFPASKTTHHFRLYADGGAIEVTANDPKDEASINEIRSHLRHIARVFSNGDFSMPMFIHSQVPPGVAELKRAKNAVSYKFEQMKAGARVRIKTTDGAAVKAVHDFLRFQIEDHHTGDIEKVSERR